MYHCLLLTAILVTYSSSAPLTDPYPATDDGRCQVGITLKGLSQQLDMDYMTGGNTYYGANQEGISTGFSLSYTWTWKQCNHTRYGCAGYGCDFFDGCPKADADAAREKWAILSGNGMGPTKVLAICEEGCPHWTPNCIDLYTAGGKPAVNPADPPYLCPLWPKEWATAQQKWRIVASNETRTVTYSCCERKPQLCDACNSNTTCSGLSGLLIHRCPPHKALFPLTKVQQNCCQQTESPILPITSCECKASPFQCQH